VHRDQSIVSAARERIVAGLLILLAVAAMHYDVIFLGRSLIHSNYSNPLDQRGVPDNYGPGLVPHTEWANRNLSLIANLRDPGSSWWQWEPSTQYLRQSIETRDWPFWDPYHGAGTPAMANLLPAFFFPPYTAVVAVGASATLRNAYFLFLLWGAGFATYLFLRGHDIGFVAAVAGGAIVVTGGALNQNLGSIAGQIASCFPVALLATRWFLDRPGGRRGALLALTYASIALASLPPLLIGIFGVVTVYASVAMALGDAAGSRSRTAWWWAIAIVVSGGLVTFNFVPVVTLAGKIPQLADVYRGAGLETMPKVNVLQLLSPTLMGGVQVYVTAPFASYGYAAHIPYVGLAALTAAVFVSPGTSRKGRTLLLSSLIGSALVLLKLLGVPPVQWIGYLPILEHVHFAHYLGVILSFQIVFLAAMGLGAILGSRHVQSRRALAAGSIVVASVLALPAVANGYGAFEQAGKEYWIRDWRVLALVGAAIIVTLLAWKRGARPVIVAASLVGLALFEGIYNDFIPKPGTWDIYAHPPPYLRLIRRESPLGRVLAFAVPVANVSGAFRVFGVNSLMTFTPPRFYELYRRYTGSPALAFLTQPQEIPPDPVLDRANIQFVGVYKVVETDVARAEARGFAKRYDDGFVMLFERRGDPRFLFSSDYRVVPTSEALTAIATAGPREVILETEPSMPRTPNTSGDPSVVVERYRFNHIRVSVDAPRAGLLYASETSFDGWSATVNQAPARILPANYAFRAVEVPQGRSTVEFSYWPPGLTLGLWISGAALLVVVAMLVRTI
jgi:hypothetical protein